MLQVNQSLFKNCLIIVILSFFYVATSVPRAQAADPFGTELGAFNGVTAYSNCSTNCVSCNNYCNVSNDPTFNSFVDGTYMGIKWQSPEYVIRYYYEIYGLDLASKNDGDANTFFDSASTMGLNSYPNGGTIAPQVGDILVSEGGSVGHVAIVRSLTENQICTSQENWHNTADDLTICLNLTVSNGTYTVSGFSPSYPLVGWLRNPASEGTSTTTVSSTTSMVTSTTTVSTTTSMVASTTTVSSTTSMVTSTTTIPSGGGGGGGGGSTTTAATSSTTTVSGTNTTTSVPVPCASSKDCDDGLYCNGIEQCVNGLCDAGQNPCNTSQLCKEDLKECWDVVTIPALSLRKRVWTPFNFEKKRVWLLLYCADDNHFSAEQSTIVFEGEGEAFKGVTINAKRKPFKLFKFIFVPVLVEKGASAGQWKVELRTDMEGGDHPYVEVIETSFKVRQLLNLQ